MMHYKSIFDSFDNLVEKLISFLKFECINLVRPQLEFFKNVLIVVHSLMWVHVLYINMWM